MVFLPPRRRYSSVLRQFILKGLLASELPCYRAFLSLLTEVVLSVRTDVIAMNDPCNSLFVVLSLAQRELRSRSFEREHLTFLRLG